MESIHESLSKLPLSNLKKMRKTFKELYKKESSDEHLDNLVILEKVILLKEDEGGAASANAGNVGGMGNVVSAQPSCIPGQTIGASSGSGDIGVPLFGASMKTPGGGMGLAKLIQKIKSSKKLQKKLKGKNLLSYSDFIKRDKQS